VSLTPQFLSDINVDGEFSEITIADFNNDLRPDIYITGKPTTWPNQLLINTGSRFALQIAGNAVVTGDFDNDGDQDLYIDQADQAANGPNPFSITGATVRSLLFPTPAVQRTPCAVEADRWQ
jgi:FG-GAP-like repeat